MEWRKHKKLSKTPMVGLVSVIFVFRSDLWIWERKVMNLIKVLNKLADRGYCPALLFDDDGRWALSFEGIQNVNFENTSIDMSINSFVDANDWKDTIEEAVEYAVNKWSDLDGFLEEVENGSLES